MSVKEKHIFISGRVQGVGFRYFTKMNADSLGITGWVRNLSDGRVEVLIQGDDEALNKMISKLKKGPHSASVENVMIERKSDTKELHQTFFVTR